MLTALGSLIFFPALGLFAQHFTFQQYEQDQGLKNRDAFRVIQDASGLLWVATENGLYRYDGSEFRRFGAEDGLSDSLIIDVLQDSSGRIWASSTEHIFYLSGDKFRKLPGGRIHLATGQRLASSETQFLFLDRNSLYTAFPANGPGEPSGSPEENWRVAPFFNAQQLADHPELAHLHNIFIDRDGSLWVGCEKQICHVSGANIESFGTESGVPAEPWSVIFRDRGGVLWVRNSNHILARLPGSGSFLKRDMDGTLTSSNGSVVLALGQDATGRLLTQSSNGIARWEGDHWKLFDRNNGIDFNGISSILTDRQGSLWFSTRGHGLRRWLGYDNVENWTVTQGMGHDLVWYIYRDHRKRLWLGDDLGINQLDRDHGRVTPASGLSGSSYPQVDTIVEAPDGALWLSNIAGQVMRSDAAADRFTQFAKLPAIARMFEDAAHRIWIFSRPGIYVIRDPVAPRLEAIDIPAVAADQFTDGTQSPDGTLWFASDHELYRYRNDTWYKIALDPSKLEGQIRSIAAAPDGTLWIGGGLPGLLHIRVDGDQARTLDYITCPELISTDIEFVRFDHRGWLWIGSDLGINVFDGTRWMLLTQLDGIVSNDINQGAFFADYDGSVWIGANGGAIHLLHPERLFPQVPLEVKLTSATLGTRALDLQGGRNLWRWHQSPLDISFTSLNYDRRGSLVFRYRLVGLESSWIRTTDHLVHYAAVPPGSYQFEVQALDINQQRVSGVAGFTLTVRPPWWRTRLFYTALAALSFLLSLLLWRWRERRLIRRQEILERMIAQRTSELEAEKVELEAAREALQYQATHDALTGVWNRSAILEILEDELLHARRDGTALGVVLTDIDHFKGINDTHGHLAGDTILRDASKRMQQAIRGSDCIGRYGGEEFLIILPGLALHSHSPRLVDLQEAISGAPFLHRQDEIRITASFGVAWARPEEALSSVEDLIHRADEALYIAKAQGRNRIFFDVDPEISSTPLGESQAVSVRESYGSRPIP